MSIFFQSGVDGLIISNTTVVRPDSLESKHKGETGGLSGAPLTEMSTGVIRDMYRLTNGETLHQVKFNLIYMFF